MTNKKPDFQQDQFVKLSEFGNCSLQIPKHNGQTSFLQFYLELQVDVFLPHTHTDASNICRTAVPYCGLVLWHFGLFAAG